MKMTKARRLQKVWIDQPTAVSSLDTDGEDYHILANAAKLISNIKGLTCEIGVRAGGSSKIIIDAIMASKPIAIRTHIAIDPYGDLDYEYNDDEIIEKAYSDKLRDIAIPALYRYCVGSKVNFLFFQMTDTQFFTRFGDGVPIYINGKEYITNVYAFVYFDGPHTTKATLTEMMFFEQKTVPGSIFVFDDVTFYNHDKLQKILLAKNWKVLEETEHKISYVKIK